MSEHPAGWYPDPRGRHEYRYWDGSVWTDHVADQGVSGTDPVNVVGPSKNEEPEPAAAETVERAPEPTIPAEQEPDNTPAPAAEESSAASGLWSSETSSESAAASSSEPATSSTSEPAASPQPEPAAASPEPAALSPEPAAASPEPAASSPEPAAASPEPASSDAPSDPGTATSAAAAASAGAAASEPGGASTGPAASEPAGSSVDPAADPGAAALNEPSGTGGSAGAPPPPSSSTGPNAGDQAKAALKSATATKSPALAGLLTVAFPGSGHFYLGAGDKTPLAIGLLALTLAAYVVSWFSFTSFVIAFVIWAAAAAYGVFDLQGVLKPIREAGAAAASISPQQVGLVLVAGGILLVIGLFLPWYHISVDITGPASAFGGFGGISDSGNAFKALEALDVVLLIIGIAVVVLGATAMGLGPLTGQKLPPWLPVATAGVGVVALVIVAFRMLSVGADIPDASGISVAIGRGPGILLSGAASLAIAAAGLVSLIQSPRANNASRSEDTTAS